MAYTAVGAPPHVFDVAAYTNPSVQINPVAVAFGGRNLTGATARSPVSGMMPRSKPSAATLNTKFGPRAGGVFARAGGGVPRAGSPTRLGAGPAGLPAVAAPAAEAGASPPPPPRLPRAARRAAISASCGAPFPGSPISPFAGRGGRAKPKNASCVGGVNGVARVSGTVIPPGQVGDPAYSRAPAV